MRVGRGVYYSLGDLEAWLMVFVDCIVWDVRWSNVPGV